MSAQKGAAQKSPVSALYLEATITQPMTTLLSHELIDPDLEIDARSAIDQFVATIEELNVVLARHSRMGGAGKGEVEVATDSDGASLESLFAIDDSIEDSNGIEIDLCNQEASDGEGMDGAALPKSSSSSSAEDEVTLQLNNLVFLGYMSAVESYFRCLTRQLIHVDEYTAEAVQDVKIAFGAAKHAAPGLLPEVLMEDMTFTTNDSIRDLLNKVIGVGVDGVSDLIKEYDRICQLRHCIVHRFGRLGTRNAMKLGFGVHKSLLERKIKIPGAKLEDIAFNLLNFVKSINNHVYSGVMKRSSSQSLDWQWDIDSDREAFSRYYSIFQKTTSPGESLHVDDAYNAFRSTFEKGSATQVQRAKQARLA
ncbi:TPA: hypothetical protein ACKP7S_000277 [Stenotrophomonas maltophilia]